MPYYDYVCENCNEEFERYLSYNDVKNGFPDIPCSRCGKFHTRRKISLSPVVFVGEGFYTTDSKNE